MSIQSSFVSRSLSSCIPGSSSQASAVSNRNRMAGILSTFWQDVNNITQDGGQSTISLTSYLNRELFSHRWRSYCVDYGIPAHLTRDGALSTKNFAEAASRLSIVSSSVGCRVNKRSVPLEVSSGNIPDVVQIGSTIDHHLAFRGFPHAWSGRTADGRPRTVETGAAGVSRISLSGLVSATFHLDSGTISPSYWRDRRNVTSLFGREALLSRSTSSKGFSNRTGGKG